MKKPSPKRGLVWWAMTGSNCRHPACKLRTHRQNTLKVYHFYVVIASPFYLEFIGYNEVYTLL